MAEPDGAGSLLQRAWTRLRGLPGGPWLFSRLLGWVVPYSGTIGARVEALEPGYARVRLRERRRIRNHLSSIHAVALANLGELTSGLAVTLSMPPGVRGIPIRICTDYHKKARGRLVAESRVELPEIAEPRDVRVRAEIRDAQEDVVAETAVTWRLERRPGGGGDPEGTPAGELAGEASSGDPS